VVVGTAESVRNFTRGRRFRREIRQLQSSIQGGVCYLADSLVHLVTSEANMNLRTRGSPQADRILAFDELKARRSKKIPGHYIGKSEVNTVG